MKYTVGKKITPTPKVRENDENNLYGAGWRAVRTEHGFELSWDGGELQTKIVKVAISEEEFERLRQEPDAFYEIALEHDPNK